MVHSRASFLLPLIALAASGCVSNSNGIAPGDDGGLIVSDDSGPQPIINEDATVPFDSSVPDSSVPETSTPGEDAGGDAGPAPVTVLISNDIGPEPGVLIIFQDATGAVMGTAATGAAGTVTQSLAPNSQVTVVLSNGSSGQIGLVTIQGVQPGDTVTAFDDLNLAFPSTSLQLTEVPDAGTLDASSILAISGTSGTNIDSLPSTISVGYSYGTFPNEIAGESPVLLTLSDDTNTEVAYAYKKSNVLLADGGAQVAVPGPWLTAEPIQTFNVTLYTDDAGLTTNPEIVYGEIAGGVYSEPGSITSSTAAGVLSSTFKGHPGYADAVQTEATLNDYITYPYAAIRSIAAHVDASAPAPGVDMSQMLPQITAATVDTTDAGTTARPFISWTAAGPLASLDGFIVVAQVNFSLADGGGGGGTFWRIVAPPTSTSVTPPALPASVGTVQALTGQYIVPTVIGVEASYLAGYAQMRQAFVTLTPTNAILNDNSAPISPVMPVDGTLRMTAVTNSGD